MCFIANKITFKIAKKDKIYYKVLKTTGDKLESPFYNTFPIHIGTYIDTSNELKGIYSTRLINVGEGFIHLFRRKRDAINVKILWNRDTDQKMYFVVKAIIPRGTIYAKNRKEVITTGVIYESL